MTSFGKKIIGAFLEVEAHDTTNRSVTPTAPVAPTPLAMAPDTVAPPTTERADDRFAGHFEKLLGDNNIPGPDYYEFARMVAVMSAIPDEAARYNAAFAGLQVQGLDKQRLLDTAAGYLKVLSADAEQFDATVKASYQEKVQGKEKEAQELASRIQALSQEIIQLQQRIGALNEEVKASKDKLTAGNTAYSTESKRRQNEIRESIEKINRYIR